MGTSEKGWRVPGIVGDHEYALFLDMLPTCLAIYHMSHFNVKPLPRCGLLYAHEEKLSTGHLARYLGRCLRTLLCRVFL